MPAGPVTLAAIARDGARKPYRPVQHTIDYGDRISNAPGAVSPRTRAALGDPAHHVAAAVSVEQVLSYVVRANAGTISSPSDLRRVVDDSILARLSPDVRGSVAHVDVEPALAEGTWFVRVRVPLR
jgi:hypothetical protein